MTIDDVFPRRICTYCGVEKSSADFPVASFITDTLRSRCAACISMFQRNRRRSNPNQKHADRRFNLRYKFGIELDEYNALLTKQGGLCAICKRPEQACVEGRSKYLAIDHCHTTGRNRGLLCSRCNIAIGNFGDSIETLKSAIRYLQQHTHERNKNMHINQLKESNYLKKEDCDPPLMVTIDHLTQKNVALEGDPPDMKYCLHFQEDVKPMILNSTNAQLIARAVGSEETDNWKGRQVVLYNDPNVSFQGKLVGGIRVRASVVEQAPRPAPARKPQPVQFAPEPDDETNIPF